MFLKTNINGLCSLMTTPENHFRPVIRLPFPGTKCFGDSILQHFSNIKKVTL